MSEHECPLPPITYYKGWERVKCADCKQLWKSVTHFTKDNLWNVWEKTEQ